MNTGLVGKKVEGCNGSQKIKKSLTVGETIASQIRMDDSTERRQNLNLTFMEHPKELKELSKIMFYQMEDYDQIVHDLLEILEEEVMNYEVELSESLLAISYDIRNLLEVIDAERKKDIYALNLMQEIIGSIYNG